jgi:hypothetical protein
VNSGSNDDDDDEWAEFEGASSSVVKAATSKSESLHPTNLTLNSTEQSVARSVEVSSSGSREQSSSFPLEMKQSLTSTSEPKKMSGSLEEPNRELVALRAIIGDSFEEVNKMNDKLLLSSYLIVALTKFKLEPSTVNELLHAPFTISDGFLV